ncbi:molybdopterin-dependent oxidoreductase [Halorussus salinisoli]|uniref:molybdopterin-dependent oxidoreductase n=1 Tax=Halorussus salinisoli TaxID=2558242 RepID=UPI0010C1C59F|nr:molybdopterin-dependent oxidoreductase [Halorussus salinisoli]
MQSANVESNEDGERTPTGPEPPGPVEVEGRKTVVVSPAETRTGDLPRATRTCTVECASGVRATDEWAGVPVDALAAAADFPGETTHLRIEAAEFAADVPVLPSLDGIVAFERRGGRDDEEAGLPRFVADGVDGERLVKRVERISAVTLDAGEEPRVG